MPVTRVGGTNGSVTAITRNGEYGVVVKVYEIGKDHFGGEVVSFTLTYQQAALLAARLIFVVAGANAR